MIQVFGVGNILMHPVDLNINSGDKEVDALLKAFLYFGDEDFSIERMGKISINLFGQNDKAKAKWMAAIKYLEAYQHLVDGPVEGSA